MISFPCQVPVPSSLLPEPEIVNLDDDIEEEDEEEVENQNGEKRSNECVTECWESSIRHLSHADNLEAEEIELTERDIAELEGDGVGADGGGGDSYGGERCCCRCHVGVADNDKREEGSHCVHCSITVSIDASERCQWNDEKNFLSVPPRERLHP